MDKKIFHIVESIKFESGGLRTVITDLDNYLNDDSHFDSNILTFGKEKHDKYLEFDLDFPKTWNYSKVYSTYIENIDKESILHLHGVWMYPQYKASKTALTKNSPYVVSSHGMLQDYLFKQGWLKKSLYHKFILDKILKNATVLHAITKTERDILYKLSNGNKNIVEIPNLFHFNKIPHLTEYNPEDEYLLFLGRFHVVKGIKLLLDAFNKIDNKKIKLILIGPPSEYKTEMQEYAKKIGIDKRLVFKEFVTGKEKYELFKNAKAFVAPSYSEVIGMVNLEAAACKAPVITTFNTGINPEWNTNGGIMIKPDVEELITALNQAVSWDITERLERGKQMADYVLQNYSWEQKGILWEQLYDSL
ncbi:hypothetical protein FEDK69T_06120 [Flavobacterium enshiense DK69]|uniref:Glycosyl transferase family 1 domain-containing protein n=1 Tax=Flavobacterium enshiense DK69 TaxID=1107311 RepID=V6SIF6_9FLAO|nr:glycosyltransferase [Flavobacterium enshiense]ESU24175.1 hypothetical protein FEDK69T_06120 [Flavobacterium enshiense DK69]KGO95448.1 hypothetical protein Q767_11640 [Flavobacterium enshiense DK69]